MSRYQRLQHNLRSPVRRRKLMKNRHARVLRRQINAAFDKTIATQFPAGFDFRSLAVREPTPGERFRQRRRAR